ncbi:hypothetical protein PGT21_021189 [Puccinia graminis f. sp. tritici]|uniref:Uncharacterized protein n=1 Tax=Puccinia graminis f. sp. tritici TaxID=56615 RepID=A0A5B0QFY4_PUCGR|nr:hypothetical protein PGT21_021189 [Puccinia graminis f. sp. tritici]
MHQDQGRNTYVQIESQSEYELPSELQEPQNPKTCSSKMNNFFQAALWCLAGGTLIGFAVSVLWWEPVCQSPTSSTSNSVPQNPVLNYNNTQSRVYSSTRVFLKKEEECNPFHEKGFLHYNASEPGDNTWRPYAPDCKPSNLFQKLKQDLHSTRETFGASEKDEFAWLRNRTVVLIGDSIDRWHNVDFCNVLSWEPGSTERDPIISENRPTKTYYVGADSPLSPPPWHFHPEDPLKPPEDWPEDEHELFKFQTPIWDAGQINANTTRPRVCEIPKYGFRVVSLFSWGLDPKEGGRLYANISGYFPPAEYTSRIDHILKPILENLATQSNNTLVTKPDLIEMSSGFWDLRQWAEEDKKIMEKRIGKPIDYPTEYGIGFSDLDQDRLNWWSERQKKAIRFVSDAFPQSQTPILWRSLHHTQTHHWVGYDRVNQIDQLARYNIEKLKLEDSSLEPRLRIDEWGALMLGQEHHFRDVMHVRELPGGVLWGDVMLWELRRAVKKRGSTYYSA